MLVKTTCPICHCDTYIQVDAEEYARWQAGELIQVAMPYLHPEDREMLISGICPDCWNEQFVDEYGDGEDLWLSEEDFDETGFNPYMGCYDFDC